ncbi:hypothetical protein Pmani_022183 [Petrolisthes manimaculis]|uniref:Uncharacterized protein n=1 Tax=Petrolisthes manimaculis TaxID=1843537 RepID=A0AAE1PDF4_9EUCA|nr:hypothetical protein Pmani_022183 [Petrolisthes manimaculis]
MANIMLRQHETREFTESFFKFVTERVVLAQVKSEMGDVDVTTLLNRLTSWSVEALVVYMRVISHSWGRCDISGLSNFGTVVHHRARRSLPYTWYPEFEKIWAVIEVQNAVGVGGPPLNVYVALSVGQEGWCVLTSNFHTLVHVLRNHGMCTRFLVGQLMCTSDCGQICDELVACVRPSKAPLTYQTSISIGQHSLADLESEIKYRSLKDIPEAKVFLKQTVYYYSSLPWYYDDYYLLLGFDFEGRKHWAIGRKCINHPQFVLEREEMKAREFLACLSLYLKPHFFIKDFLCFFTRLSNINREEAMEIMSSNLPLPLSLSETAFQILCQLPLCYLHQYSPPLLYKNIKSKHSVVGTPAPYRMTTQDVVKQLDQS